MTLTPRQSAIFEYIRESIAVRGYPPTVREIGEKFGIQNNGVVGHLKLMEKKGVITRERYKSRAIRVVEATQ